MIINLEKILNFGRRIIPKKIFRFFQPFYHYFLAMLAGLYCRYPSKKIFVLGVTGTKGKTTVVEIINAIFEEAGYKTALFSTLRFKIAGSSERNLKKMTAPGRFFIQRFLKKAAGAGCQYVFLEMTSQGVLQSRHKFIDFDAMLFTNLAPEHIESHGSFEKYREAKLELFKILQKSAKKRKTTIINADDENAEYFLGLKTDETWLYGLKKDSLNYLAHRDNLKKLRVLSYNILDSGLDFTIKEHRFRSPLLGRFNLYNIIAAISFAKSQDVGWEIIKKALEKFSDVPGRVEFINEGQDFKVVVDYAHTPESLEKIYDLFRRSRLICVLGATGGGRDTWKRRVMGKIADTYCDKIILTNEDPYDEDPRKIAEDVADGIENKEKYEVIMDRRKAIAEAIQKAKTGDTVIITGKGTDPFIMGPKDTKTPWDDRDVTREELKNLLKK